MQLNAKLTLLGLLLLTGCSTPNADATTAIATVDMDQFRHLEEPMGAACGSLDCHGQPGRNLRLYDFRGRRLSPAEIPGDGGSKTGTTDDELTADLRSVLALEPDITNQVFKEGGASPERLTIVRKARGTEEHKGSIVWPQGSDGDRCLTSWLASSVDAAACTRATAAFSNE